MDLELVASLYSLAWYIRQSITGHLFDTLQLNSYQAVLITDGQASYAVFTYKCGMLEWSANATIGFNTDGTLYRNHYLSGSSSAVNIACLNSLDSPWSSVVYQLCKSII